MYCISCLQGNRLHCIFGDVFFVSRFFWKLWDLLAICDFLGNVIGCLTLSEILALLRRPPTRRIPSASRWGSRRSTQLVIYKIESRCFTVTLLMNFPLALKERSVLIPSSKCSLIARGALYRIIKVIQVRLTTISDDCELLYENPVT